MVFASSLGAVIHMTGLLCIQAPYLIYIIIVRPLDGYQQNLVECINEIFFTLAVIFLIFYNTEQAWSRDIEITFINFLLANGLIIFLISIIAFIIILVHWIRKKLRSNQSNRIVKPTSQSIQCIRPEPELQLRQSPANSPKGEPLSSVSRIDFPQRGKLNEESKEELPKSLP